MYTCIAEAIEEHARLAPEHAALCIGKECYSYADLWSGIRTAAANLKKQGAGTTLLLSADKTFSTVCYYFGAHLAGLRVLPTDSHLTQDGADAIARNINITAYLSTKVTINGAVAISADTTEEPLSAPPVFPRADSVADIMFTTGTTGTPKSVPLTHGNLLAAAININTFIGTGSDDKEVIALPLCHSFGMGRLRCLFLAGATAVLIPNFGNERKVLKTLQESDITGFAMVPSAWQYLKQLCGERFAAAAAGLRYIEFGSAPLPEADKKWLMVHLPHTRLCMHYGLTEASRSCFIEFHSEKEHLHTVGRAAPHTEVAVFTPEGERVGPNTTGEVCIKGAHVTPGYLNLPAAESFFGSFFRSGDMGYLDEEGYLHLVGRLKEIINTGGKKVSPTEVEEWIEQYAGVRECACISAPDPDGILGEVVKACIVWESAADEPGLRRFLREHLEPHKQPRLYRCMDTPLPRTESGKLQRRKLL